MGDPVGLALSPWAAATEINGSQTEDASVGVPRQVQLLLEILIVLMCVGAVTGTAADATRIEHTFLYESIIYFHMLLAYKQVK